MILDGKTLLIIVGCGRDEKIDVLFVGQLNATLGLVLVGLDLNGS
jgi:hypothetical protein